MMRDAEDLEEVGRDERPSTRESAEASLAAEAALQRALARLKVARRRRERPV